MKEKLTRNSVRALLPFGFASALLVVLLCSLSKAIRAQPGVSSAATPRESNRPDLLNYQAGVSVCEQTGNQVPDPGFDQGIGRYTHWHCEGECNFQADQPGHDSDPSAVIFDQPGEDECRLVTPVHEIYVEHDRWYDYGAWLKTGPLDGNAFLRIRFYKWKDGWEATGPLAPTNAVTDTGGAWVRVTGSAQAPPDAGYARVEAVLPASSAGSVWVDDVFFGLATCLAISKHDEPDPVSPDQLLTYTIVYSNTGREKATNVQIVETYDKDVEFVITGTQPPPDKGNTIWEVPELSPGDSGTITVVVHVEDDAKERVSVINCVQLDSDESDLTVKLVYTCIPTAIITDGCAIDVFPPRAEKTVGPGDPANYYLTVYNVGSCDGRADLGATSSRGWGITIAPSTTYTLPKSNFQEVTVGLTVPLDARGGVSDVTFITATLVCGPPCNKTVTATATVTTTIGVSPTAVEISGPETGHVDTAYTFIATVSPPTATDPICTWFPPPMAGQGSAIVTYTWSTTGTKTMTVTATNAGGAAVGFHSISIGWYKVYLPLVLRNWPPIPPKPELYAIDNEDIDGNYPVCWSAVGLADFYVLEEATNSAFTGATKVYTTTDTCYPISVEDCGRYYYHVRACDGWGCSGWSNVEEVGAWWEREENDSLSQANGPLISCKDYCGYHDDFRDYFSISLGTGEHVTMKLSNYSGTGVQLQLWDQSGNPVCRDWRPPYEITCTVNKAGWYYICVKTESGCNTDTPYVLHATFP